MTIVLLVITWIGILLILILSSFIGKYFFLKTRGSPTGKFTNHNYDQKYSSEILACLLFVIIFFFSSYIGILMWIEILNSLLM